MKSLKGTKTERNLLTAFSGESQARMRYDFFSAQAGKEGFQQISYLFMETADNERAHAKRLFKYLEGGEVEIQASYPAGMIVDTHENLLDAAAGEHYESTIMYPSFAVIAEEEGFKEIATVMRHIAMAEAYHEERYLRFAKEVKEGRSFIREKNVKWHCRKCGYLHEGQTPPKRCPACAHPEAYFEVLGSTW